MILSERSAEILALDIRGFVFFGAAAALLARLKREAGVDDEDEAPSPVSWVVLDCSDCAGVDATAVRACFVPFQQLLLQKRAKLLFCGLRPHVRESLERHGADLNRACFKTADAALEAAEDALLKRATAGQPTQRPPDSFDELRPLENAARPLEEILGEYLEDEKRDLAAAAGDLGKYFSRHSISQGDALFAHGDEAKTIYVVHAGTVDLKQAGKRIARVKRGGVLGELCFLLRHRQSLDAAAATHVDLWSLTRDSYDAMRRDQPVLHGLIQTALLKSMALQVSEGLSIGNWG